MLRASNLASMMTSKLRKKSFDFNRSVCHQYDYIVNRITSFAKTTDELVDLEKYIDNLRSGPLLQLKVNMMNIHRRTSRRGGGGGEGMAAAPPPAAEIM